MLNHFGINETGRDFVVGDVHGCFDLLSAKLEELNFDQQNDRLFSVGDLVDRGPQSEQSIDWLNRPWFHAVRGNHEQMAIDVVAETLDVEMYLRNGGAWFLALPKNEQKHYVEIFEELPFAIDVQTKNGLVGIVHAECPVDNWVKLEGELSGERADLFKEVCLWDRFRVEHNVTTTISGAHSIFVGHTSVSTPAVLGNTVYIDTGAVFGGTLTVIKIN